MYAGLGLVREQPRVLLVDEPRAAKSLIMEITYRACVFADHVSTVDDVRGFLDEDPKVELIAIGVQLLDGKDSRAQLESLRHEFAGEILITARPRTALNVPGVREVFAGNMVNEIARHFHHVVKA